MSTTNKTVSPAKVANIRHSYFYEEKSMSAIAKRWNVSRSTVSNIVNGKTYNNLQERRIKGFDNYIIYPNGRVFSTTQSKFLKPVQKRSDNKTKYVSLYNQGTRRQIPVSSLVETYFG